MWSFQACQLNRWPREYPALAQGFSSAPVSQRICIDPLGSNPACGSNNPLSIHFTTQFQLKVSGPWLSRTEQQNSAEHARRSRLDSHLRTSPGLLLKSGSSFHRVLESVILCAKNHFYCLFRVNKNLTQHTGSQAPGAKSRSNHHYYPKDIRKKWTLLVHIRDIHNFPYILLLFAISLRAGSQVRRFCRLVNTFEFFISGRDCCKLTLECSVNRHFKWRRLFIETIFWDDRNHWRNTWHSGIPHTSGSFAPSFTFESEL